MGSSPRFGEVLKRAQRPLDGRQKRKRPLKSGPWIRK